MLQKLALPSKTIQLLPTKCQGFGMTWAKLGFAECEASYFESGSLLPAPAGFIQKSGQGIFVGISFPVVFQPLNATFHLASHLCQNCSQQSSAITGIKLFLFRENDLIVSKVPLLWQGIRPPEWCEDMISNLFLLLGMEAISKQQDLWIRDMVWPHCTPPDSALPYPGLPCSSGWASGRCSKIEGCRLAQRKALWTPRPQWLHLHLCHQNLFKLSGPKAFTVLKTITCLPFLRQDIEEKDGDVHLLPREKLTKQQNSKRNLPSSLGDCFACISSDSIS